jgi:hypothetical protein
MAANIVAGRSAARKSSENPVRQEQSVFRRGGGGVTSQDALGQKDAHGLPADVLELQGGHVTDVEL